MKNKEHTLKNGLRAEHLITGLTRLRAERLLAGISARALSRRIGRSNMFISRLERGLSARLDETTAIRIADALRVSPDALFKESDR